LQDADGDGVCDADDICPNGDDNIDTDGDGIPDACDTNACTDAGKPCDDGNDCTVGDIFDADCNCISGTLQDADGDGVCDTEDCAKDDANYPKAPGTGCDDGNPNTGNDVIQADGCGCAGTLINNGEPDCDAVTATPGSGTITVAGLTSPVERVKVYFIGRGGSWIQVANCTGDCGDTWVAEGLAAGNYIIHYTLLNANWGSLCENGEQDIQLEVTVLNGASSRNSPTTSLAIEQTITDNLIVYPNPAKQMVNLDLSKWTNKSVNIAISNHLSQVVYEQHIEQVVSTKQIDLTNFANGIYYIQVQGTADAQPIVKKLIVNRQY
ncbi:MAG: T9SS type A sorting domain-containing protein, partial [Saprospiraceae bacterium]